MCGQFAIFSNIRAIIDYYNFLKMFEGEFSPELMHEFLKTKKEKNTDNKYEFPNEKISPGMYAPLLTKQFGKKGLNWFKWGLIPAWSKDDSFAKKLINARIETISEKPSFKNAIQYRRGLLALNYFYEWDNDKKVHKISLRDHEIFSLGTIWEIWKHEGKEIFTYSIITQEANRQMQGIHERMPLIIKADNYTDWLNCKDIKSFQNKQEDLLLKIS